MSKYRVNTLGVHLIFLGEPMNINFKEVDMESYKSFINVQGSTTSNNASTVSRIGNNSGFSVDITSKVTENAYKSQGKTIKEVMNEAENINLEAYRDYMTVMSNCVSSEDLAELEKEGFNPKEISFEDVVTIVDHIKAAVAKGGTNVIGYTDDISKETLLEITKDPAFANALSNKFIEKDIPLTEDNVSSIVDNYDKLSEIQDFSEANLKYMVENNLEPTVNNLYTAAYASGKNAEYQGHGYYNAGDVQGYYAKKPEEINVESLLPQMKGIIEGSGFEANEENIGIATWIVKKGIPLTKESFSEYKEVTSINLPMSKEEFALHATDAIMDGISVGDYNLARNMSMRQEASNIYDEAMTSGTIKGRRILEEVRLSMTIEANYRLLKSGYQIDTAPMEELVKKLKEMEKEFSINLAHDEDEIEAVRKKDLYDATNDLVERLKSQPAAVAWTYERKDTLEIVSSKATNLELQYERANTKYETLMTAPRRDLGDSISEAFRNVDDILYDMGLSASEENERAVRILGYNSVEITEENIEIIKEKDRLLTRTINNLTPSRVLGLIRSNINPITMPIDELNEYLEAQKTVKDDMLSYSRFLYRLEKKNDITEEEKEAYIGVFRLLAQIEKGDYSSVGAIASMGAELNLANISSAIKSKAHKPMDYKVDDSFGGIEGNVTKSLKEMLEKVDSIEVEKELYEEETNEFRSALKTETEILEMLNATNTPVSANNIESMTEMLNTPLSVFDRLRKFGFKKENRISLDSKEKAQSSFKEFSGSVKDFLENKVFGENESLSLNSVDVKSIEKIYRHMEFLEKQSDEENYIIPTTVDGEEVAINLRVLHNNDDEKVEIKFESTSFGQVKGIIVPKDNGLSGTYTCTNVDGLKRLNDSENDLQSALNEISDKDVISTDDLYKAAKVFIEFVQKAA